MHKCCSFGGIVEHQGYS